ncbi:flagellar export protein FliJ [Kurthia zopfii]|uniref:flagellar export protein FliJ n=1 Tax=Kurthia zopfii TaxID=1650 RepID=UPI000F6B62A9|nr:flagellar export protein FliJ [Kurthia zopfii]VEI04704.1 Chemotaxis CheF protein [Kurthia zopfii]
MGSVFHYRFDQVMTIKEQEKNESEMAYKESVSDFEKIATDLFEALKKKEDLIIFQQERMSTGLSILEMHNYVNFIDSIEKKIAELQQKVIQARSKMEWFEAKLLEISLECKKYEKMKEKEQTLFNLEQDRIEVIQLDEMSQIAFYNKEVR